MTKCFMKVICFIVVLVILGSAQIIHAADGFETNLTGWKGLESSWTKTNKGYADGAEQSVFDIAVSDGSVDCSKDFTYMVSFNKESGYGGGLVLGIKDAGSRDKALQDYIFFVVDPGSVYFTVFKNGEQSEGPVGRSLTDEEKEESGFTLSITYNTAIGMLTFMYRDKMIGTYGNADAIKGKLGLIAHDASIIVTSANLNIKEISTEIPDPVVFKTNMTGWKGVESTWTNTETHAYMDGNEQSLDDFAFSDSYVDGTKSFIYECVIQRISGYGFGLVYGAKDISEREAVLESSSRYMVDPGSVIYNINNSGATGRSLADEEKDPALMDTGNPAMAYKFTLEYSAPDGVVYLYLNDELFEAYFADDTLEGYLGILAHDARISVLSADFAYITDPTATPVSSAAASPSSAPVATKTPVQTESPAGDTGTSPFRIAMTAILIVSACVIIISVIFIMIKKKRRLK